MHRVGTGCLVETDSDVSWVINIAIFGELVEKCLTVLKTLVVSTDATNDVLVWAIDPLESLELLFHLEQQGQLFHLHVSELLQIKLANSIQLVFA